MSQVTLSASSERVLGSRNVRRLRTAGSIPGVVYGQGVSPVPVSVDAKEFRTAVSGELGLNTVIDLQSAAGNFIVMAREIQRHPTRGTVAHIDFQVIDPKAGVVVEVPIHVVGDAVEVRHQDWEVTQQADAAPASSPHTPLPEGVVAAQDLQYGLVGTRAGRAAKTAGTANAANA